MNSKRMLAMLLAVMMSLAVLVMPVSAAERIGDSIAQPISVTTYESKTSYTTAELKAIFLEARISVAQDGPRA